MLLFCIVTVYIFVKKCTIFIVFNGLRLTINVTFFNSIHTKIYFSLITSILLEKMQ